MLLAVLEHPQMQATVHQGGVIVAAGRGLDEALDQRPCGRALDDLVGDLPGPESDDPQRVQVSEGVAVAGQQPLGDQLQQDGVVPFEGGEDVGVGLERGQPVLGQVARATARLPTHLDRPGGMPGADRLDAGRTGLQLVLGVLVGSRCEVGRDAGAGVGVGDCLDVMQGAHQLALGEVQGVRGRDGGQQLALMGQVVQQQHLAAAVGVGELSTLESVSGCD